MLQPMKRGIGFGACLLLACQGGGSPGADGEDGIDTLDSAFDTSDEGFEEEDEGDDTGLPDLGGSVCEEWDESWIGGACGHDDDCTYADGFCLMEDEGFPCGTCTLPCDLLCPDLEGAPETFCVDASDLDLAPPEGLCVSQCDPGLLGGDGCREGYACVPLSRWMENETVKGVCIPDDLAPDQTPCLEQLSEMGLTFEPVDIEPEVPDGNPNLLCEIEDAVMLYPPISGVSWRYIDSMSEGPVLVSCETALAIAETAEILDDMGAVEFQHIGTYNCRTIGSGESLSMHGLAMAIDFYGFTMFDDSWYTLIDHWEHDVAMPVTPSGQFLKELADTWWNQDVWNIILTPNYNSAHDNHFHVDLKPGSKFYE